MMTPRLLAPRSVIAGILIASSCIGCGPRFAVLPRDDRGAGRAVANDVRVSATTEPSIRPCECGDLLVLQVTIQNGTDDLLSVSYDNFAVRTRPGEQLAVLPPFDPASGDSGSVPDNYPYAWSGFQLAPYLMPYYRGFWGATVTVTRDLAYYERHYPDVAAAATFEMRRHTLPEGLLEPEGYITGVLYFAAPRGQPAALTARLDDARSGRQVAVLEVPLGSDR